MTTPTAQQLAYYLRDPVGVSKRKCYKSLLEFVRQAWPILEPGAEFVDGQAIRLMAKCLEAVTEGKIRRLLMNVPPGFTKSMLVNVFWPAWEWGPRGMTSNRFISASYAQDLAVRDLVRCRTLVQSEWFQERWPVKFSADQDRKTYYENERTGWRMATGVTGSMTGFRGDRILIDDPHDAKGAESEAERNEARRWMTETVPTRLNKQGVSAIVMVMQRLNVQDLSGLILEGDMRKDWTCLVLPMEYEPERKCSIPALDIEDWRSKEGELLWPERFPQQAVEELKAAMSATGGTYAVAGQLQQRPAPRGGGMFKRDKAGFVDSVPKGGRRVRGWDLAATENKGCATAAVRMSLVNGKLYVEQVVRQQTDALGVERLIMSCAKQDGKVCPISLPQDPGQAGKAQKARLASLLGGYRVSFSLESGDKVDRAVPFSAQWEAGNVYLVRGTWNDRYLDELALFGPTSGKVDTDQVDASSRAYAFLLRPGPSTVGAPGMSF